MSQFWNAHWAEDAFKPTKLRNWQVPRWHAEWPNRHCEVTKCEAHESGRIFDEFKKPRNPWSKFKGTWELPLKIDRKTAENLSRFTEYKKSFWRAQRIKHEKSCEAALKMRDPCKKIFIKEKNDNQLSMENIKKDKEETLDF